MDKNASLFQEYEKHLPISVIDELKTHITDKISTERLQKILDVLVERYNHAQVSAGEAVGLVSAESIGEPGTQMCIAYDEKVMIKYDDKIHISKIGEFVDSALNTTECNEVDGYQFCDAYGISVLALNDNEKLEWKSVSKLNRHKSPEKLIHIKTKSGRKITATDFHSFVTRKHNQIVSISGKELRVGDRIPVIKYLPEHCTEAISVYEHVEMPAQDFRVKREYRPTKMLPAELALDWDFGWFVGAYLSEGCATQGIVSISNVADSYLNNAKRFISKIGLDYKDKLNDRGFAQGRDIIINSSLLARFMKNTCGSGSAFKKVPELAFSAREEFVSGLLRGYFDGDGNVAVERGMLRVSSNSEELLDGIKLLLNRFEIFASKSKDHKQHYLMIPSKYARTFLEKIGSDIDYKKAGLQELARKPNHQDYIDSISGFDDVLVSVSKKLQLPSRYVNSATKRQKIGRTALSRHVINFENESRTKGIDVSQELNVLKTMLYSDVIWDEIESIEYVSKSQGYVYDLTVPGPHTFATFDGIITHNTLNTFHFAGVSEMNVTVGLPRIIEIFDARKEIKTPMMEIFLKSPYNKADKIRDVAFEIRETKMSDVIQEIQTDIFEQKMVIKLDTVRLEKLQLKPADISALVRAKVKGISMKTEDAAIEVTAKDNTDPSAVSKLKEKIKVIHIKGIKGITQVLPVKRGEEYIILTAGSNFKEIIKLEKIDPKRTTTNNMHEIAAVLGIEAARQAIIDEVNKVIDAQGLNIDIRHVMLVADTMCVSGKVRGITRYGVVREKTSVLARASFETPIKYLINAALVGEIDHLHSVVENVMINQPVPIGTGLPGLVTKVK